MQDVGEEQRHGVDNYPPPAVVQNCEGHGIACFPSFVGKIIIASYGTRASLFGFVGTLNHRIFCIHTPPTIPALTVLMHIVAFYDDFLCFVRLKIVACLS